MYQQQIKKVGEKKLEKALWWSLDSTRNISPRENNEDNIVFSSGGQHYQNQLDQYKIDFITRYKREKINAN